MQKQEQQEEISLNIGLAMFKILLKKELINKVEYENMIQDFEKKYKEIT